MRSNYRGICFFLLFLSLFVCAGSVFSADFPRYNKMVAIGDIRISGGGYLIVEDDHPPYMAPMPNEQFEQYCHRVGSVSESEFYERKRAFEDAVVLSPSQGLETERIEVVWIEPHTSGCMHIEQVDIPESDYEISEYRCEDIGEHHFAHR